MNNLSCPPKAAMHSSTHTNVPANVPRKRPYRIVSFTTVASASRSDTIPAFKKLKPVNYTKIRRRRISQKCNAMKMILISSDLAEAAESLRLRSRAKIEKAARPPLIPAPMAKPLPEAEMHRRSFSQSVSDLRSGARGGGGSSFRR